MSATNDVTGDALVTKKTNDAYRDGWDRIFGKKPKDDEPTPMPPFTEPVYANINKPKIDLSKLKRACSNCFGSGRDLNDLPCICGCPDRS